LHAGTDEHWSVVDVPAFLAPLARALVDLVAVVFVVGHPVDVIEVLVIVL
jgi:hypothetical protein